MIQLKSPKPDFQATVDQAVVEGVQGGIMMFIRHNRVKLFPTHKCDKPLERFVSRLLSEYTPDPEGYPFTESLKEYLIIRIGEVARTLRDLYDNDEIENLIKVCRVEGGAAVAEFLERHREPVLKLIREIRGE